MESLPDRPQPTRPLAETVRAWLQWFGVVRLLVIGIAVLAVGAGAFWLLRAPPTPVEDTLPVASRTSTTVAATASAVSTSTSDEAASSDATTTTLSAVVVVDVAGAVLAPGVYELPSGSRAHQAIAAAGGLSTDADIDALNLAAPLRDGDRLYIPHVGQPVPTVILPVGGASPTGLPTVSGGSVSPAAPIDLNTATATDLDALPGVGPSTAAAIVAYREQVGPFASVDDLLNVRGIGPAKLAAIRALVAV